jgi:hypothetical protein
MVSLYFVNNRKGNEAEQAKFNQFFDEVSGALRRAAANVGTKDWDFGSVQDDAQEAALQQKFQKKFGYPSVVVHYDDKWVYLKGVGKPKDWQDLFTSIFQKAVLSQQDEKGKGTDGSGTGDKGDPKGNGNADSGNGHGSWGLNMRPCVPILDTALDWLFEQMGLDAKTIAEYKKYALLGGAGLMTWLAVNADKRVGQIGYGGAAGALAYLALVPVDPTKKC